MPGAFDRARAPALAPEEKGQAMVFEQVTRIIHRHVQQTRASITPEINLIDGAGIDSLDFLDIAYEIDRHYGIKLPLEKWVDAINAGHATTDDYFVMGKLCQTITHLVELKKPAS